MKKIIKSRVFAFILGALIFGSIGVYATSSLKADEIVYKSSNVKVALDGLYDNLGAKLFSNTFGTTEYVTSQGTPTITRSIEPKTLSKGKYIIIYSSGEAWNDGGSYSAKSEVSNWGPISCASENCVISYLGGYRNQPKATSPITGSYKTMMITTVTPYYVEIKEDTDTISAYTEAGATYATGAQFITLQIIPLN